MDKRNLFFVMIFSSVFGGVIALGGYTLFVEPQPVQLIETSKVAEPSFTSYAFDTSAYTVPEGLNFVYAAKTSTSSVVHIRTRYDASSRTNSTIDNFFREYFDEGRGEGRSHPSMGSGSGVIVDSDGYIVTNNHVVNGASEMEILLNDNRTYKGTLVGVDPTTDLAVIKIDDQNLPFINWGNSDNLDIGEWVLAVGNPYDFRSTVTAGIVSAKARNIGILARQNENPTTNLQIESFIQTDAAVNPGNSGGALVNLKGELVGINTAIISPTGAFAGYSFAVPVSLVKKVYEDLVEFGGVQRALLGISIRDVSSELAEELDLNVIRGVYIQEVRNNTSAEEAGLKDGDVIVAIDGQPVSSVSELQEKVALNRPGDKISVSYMRNGKRSDVTATLKNSAGTVAVVEVANRYSKEGAVFEEVSRNDYEELDLDGGVRVAEVNGGKWKEVGIKEGFIITKIDKREIKNIDDFNSYLDSAKGEGILLEGIYPNGEKAYYGIGW